ncbi:MAG: decaprenyl-phosphate phosphoribosyltransferase [Blastocatellia bacterium]|nr:decaprenyl-phosphate phosphoribosyltransferase [Blastocatellia bacterium]MCX7753241.1 decaprenyl-phosphate phosphoribosyltransferase [Blastocatellia bacterium]MDW8168280.1 decaprenyl-phosphate phosphoribosyltransferase [Acidobacteriota bacterium]MDW8255427.1 decaprenyl-phosphate phosphoribosyltransferase [Acidobacteriota bacterium]
MRLLVLSLRPRHWTKNLILLAPLVFSRHLFEEDRALRAAAAFGIFCLLSGSIYVLNDLRDIERDRRHPIKARRPLASGALSPRLAARFGVLLLGGALALSFWLNVGFGLTALAYAVLQVSYSLWMKAIVILDVFAIAMGFVLRAVAGGEAVAVPLSPWFFICTMLLALFLGLSKRRHELLLLERSAAEHRASLAMYSPLLLDQMIALVTAATIVTYALYTLSAETIARLHTDALKYTVPVVLYGIFRYLYLVYQKGEGGSPEMLLISDRPLFATILLYGAMVVWILYR